MKKLIVILTALCMICTLTLTAFAAGNYPSNNADWGIEISLDTDNNVIVKVDSDKIEASHANFSYQWSYIAIYTEDPNFNADSNMTGDGNPYTEAVAGKGDAGKVDATTYKIGTGEGAATYNFEEDATYYFVVCACDGSGWVWNYEPVEFVYDTDGDNNDGDNKTDDDNATDSADISVIAYAVAALTASGAIVAIKRKRA